MEKFMPGEKIYYLVYDKKYFGIVCTDEEAEEYIRDLELDRFKSEYVIARWNNKDRLGHAKRSVCHLEKHSCVDHNWITVHKGDPIYEGTFCKNCLVKQP